MYFLILLLPLIGCFISGFFGYLIGNKGSSYLNSICIGITTLLSWNLLLNQLIDNSSIIIKLPIYWVNTNTLSLEWSFLFDSLTIIMLTFVTTVSFIVHIYSIEYMKEDPHFCRFMSYISGFTFFMVVLVTSNNFIQLFLGWEGVGLMSYLLITFWYTRIEANKSAIKAMLVNKLGDVGLLLGICFIFFSLNSLDFSVVFSTIHLINEQYINLCSINFNIIDIICFFLFIGCIGKSAQIGLHTWLPDAMEGPTPVSALIHAATMVTAGVFLLIRCSSIFELSSTILNIITCFGAFTCFISASIALVQNDLKKIIAYSTCSQLGYMVFACGLSNYTVSIYHLANHAFFKALLFLSAGCIIHSINDEQDIRKMGGLVNILPYTYIMVLIGSLSLAGFPYLTGFYSKDVILEIAYSKYTNVSLFAYWLGIISAAGTAFYSFRLIILVFYNKINLNYKIIPNIHESSILMSLSLGILAIGSIFVGYLSRDFFIGMGTSFWNNSITTNFNHINIIDSEFIPVFIKLIPVVLSLLGAYTAIILYNRYEIFVYNLSNKYKNLYKFLVNKYYFDIIYNNYIVIKLLYFGYNISYKLIDKGILEIVGPYGISNIILNLSNQITKLQTGLIYNYSFIMLSFLLVYINITLFISYYINIDIIILYIILSISYFYIKK